MTELDRQALCYECAELCGPHFSGPFVMPAQKDAPRPKCISCETVLAIMDVSTLFTYPLRTVFLGLQKTGKQSCVFPSVTRQVFRDAFGKTSHFSESKHKGRAVLVTLHEIDNLFPMQRIDKEQGLGGAKADPITGEMVIIAPPVTLSYQKNEYGAEKLTAEFHAVGVRRDSSVNMHQLHCLDEEGWTGQPRPKAVKELAVRSNQLTAQERNRRTVKKQQVLVHVYTKAVQMADSLTMCAQFKTPLEKKRTEAVEAVVLATFRCQDPAVQAACIAHEIGLPTSLQAAPHTVRSAPQSFKNKQSPPRSEDNT